MYFGIFIEEYASAVFEKWKPGQKNKDNGVLLLVSIEDRLVRIETGYGLEGVLTDTKCGLIIRKVIIPHFKSGDYEKGIIEGVKTVCAVAAGDEETFGELERNDAESERENTESGKNGSSVFAFLPFIFWGIFILIVVLSKKYGKKNNGGSDDDDDTNSRGRPFFGDPCSGSGWFGPRGGFGGGPGHGGFSGGGGGRSGGGGASGGW